jgi:hypothetical protein
MKLHPIPPNLFCVPAAVAALTGADLESVVVPGLNRHMQYRGGLMDTVVGVCTREVVPPLLRELGYRVREYRSDAEAGKARAHVATWARRSRERWPGRALLMCTRSHCVVLRDGVVYDNWMPHGVRGEDHPFARSVVVWAALVEKV